MVVYADVIFLTNFLFDTGILLILLKISSKRIPVLRLILSACMGGIQSLFVFVPYFQILCLPPARFAAAFLMTLIVFYPCSAYEVFRSGTVFLAAAFAFSGAINFFRLNATWGIVMLAPVYLLLSFAKRTSSRKYKEATLIYGDKEVTFDGFYDSGNMMDYNGAPVILAGDKVFKRMFGNGFSIKAAAEWADVRDLRIVP